MLSWRSPALFPLPLPTLFLTLSPFHGVGDVTFERPLFSHSGVQQRANSQCVRAGRRHDSRVTHARTRTDKRTRTHELEYVHALAPTHEHPASARPRTLPPRSFAREAIMRDDWTRRIRKRKGGEDCGRGSRDIRGLRTKTGSRDIPNRDSGLRERGALANGMQIMRRL